MSAVHRPTPPAAGGLALRALGLWLVLMALESAHGVLRRLLVEPMVGDLTARRLGVLTGSLLVLATAWLLRRWLEPAGGGARLAIGLAWAALTFGFETGLGFALGYSPGRVLSDYDLPHGGLMPLGLLVLALSPLAVRRPGRREAVARSHRPL